MATVWIRGVGWGWSVNTLGHAASPGIDYEHRDNITIEEPVFFDGDVAWKSNERGETACARTILGIATCNPEQGEITGPDDAYWTRQRRYVIAFPNDIHHGVYTEAQILKFFRAGIRYVKAHKLEAA